MFENVFVLGLVFCLNPPSTVELSGMAVSLESSSSDDSDVDDDELPSLCVNKVGADVLVIVLELEKAVDVDARASMGTTPKVFLKVRSADGAGASNTSASASLGRPPECSLVIVSFSLYTRKASLLLPPNSAKAGNTSCCPCSELMCNEAEDNPREGSLQLLLSLLGWLPRDPGPGVIARGGGARVGVPGSEDMAS